MDKTKDDLIAHFGGNIALASRSLGVSRWTIERWPNAITEDMRRRMCYHFLQTIRIVPPDWMPPIDLKRGPK